MQTDKKRLLFVNDVSYLSTGYANYGRELIKRLFDSKKYEIAELGLSAGVGDRRAKEFPWVIYPNSPAPNNQAEMNEYQSNITQNNFGKWRFEDVILDFKPDYVMSFLDPWMCDFQFDSPLRRFYKWVWMPTVDSSPQDVSWLERMIDADAIFTYTDWGMDVLKKEIGNKANFQSAVPCGVEMDIFKPVKNKAEHRKSMGLSENLFIVGTVMRNQKRKLFPDLIESFSKFLKKCEENNNTELLKRSYLYLHTAYPDVGWDIPELLKEHKVAHKTLLSYKCMDPNCGHAFVSFFQDGVATCPRCGKPSAATPGTNNGVSREFLAKVIQLFDVNIQYAICEGLGIPQIEGAACGIPLMSVDYSAMSDVVRKVKGTPIRVERMFRECETNAYRAYPDNNHLVEELYKLANLPAMVRQKKGYEAYRGVLEHYTWEKTSKKWMDYFDKDTPLNKNRWLQPPNIRQLPNQIPQAEHKDFLEWTFANILEPEKINSYTFMRLLKWLNYGWRFETRGGYVVNENSFAGAGMVHAKFDQKKCIEELAKKAEERNYWEAVRCGLTKRIVPTQIVAASNRHIKEGWVTNERS